MSRARTRPTRQETRQQLLTAAATVFSEKGIGAATVSDICAKAGYTRGAFYSNFGTLDEIVISLLEEHVEANFVTMQKVLDDAPNPDVFFSAMDPTLRPASGPGLESSVLYMELMLHAYRNPDTRARVVSRGAIDRANIKTILEQFAADTGRDIPGGIDDAVELVSALDLGLALQAMLEPERQRSSLQGDILATLHGLWAK
ncbi:MAG: TetR/AcrR family transcriptional regulator [Actinobacteria bacterium]|nr:TetR/AcrR family transcriptional regulator [Actinomycetota bacterium]